MVALGASLGFVAPQTDHPISYQRTEEGPTLTYIAEPIDVSSSGSRQKGEDKGKRYLDSVILNYGYLADDDEVTRVLPQILGGGLLR
jgi:hypothetical protein